MGTRPEYLYFDIQLIIGNTARSKNKDETVTITQWNDAETVNEEKENYEFDDIADDEVDDKYILQKWQKIMKNPVGQFNRFNLFLVERENNFATIILPFICLI